MNPTETLFRLLLFLHITIITNASTLKPMNHSISNQMYFHPSYRGVQKTLSGEVYHALGAGHFKIRCSLGRLLTTRLFHECTKNAKMQETLLAHGMLP
jgi:hypothetical protein